VLLLLGTLRDRAEPKRIASIVGAYGLSLVLSLSIGARMMGAGDSFAGLPEPGFNLYIANTLGNDSAYFRPVPFASADPAQQATGFVVEASRRAERKLSVAEARAYWIDETWREWRSRPDAAARKVYEKVLASLNRYEAANNHDLQFIASHVRGLRLGFLSFPWLLGLAAVGLLRSPNESRPARALALLAFCYWLTLLVFFADSRIRAPLAAALIPFSALGIAELIATQMHEPKRRLSVVWPGVLAAAVTFLPCRGAGDASTALNFHALFLFESGDLDAAESFYERSTQTGGRDAASAYLGLAAIAEKRGDLDAAVAELERIPDDHYKAADKYLQLGSIMARRNHFEPAIAAFERSLSINSSTLQVYPVLQLLYEKLGRSEQAAGAAQRYALVQSFYDTQPGS
jgi:tetratricopeptide (TPR) repeat protein